MEERRKIHITTLYDPSLFWFLYEKDIPNRNELGEELKKKHKTCAFTTYQNVEQGMKVLVNYSNEWLRAEIILIKEKESNKNAFICWLLDYGISIEVENVYKMPDLVRDIPPYAKKAKLFGLISIIKEFDFLSGKMKDTRVKKWFPGIRNQLKEYLSKPGITQYFTEKHTLNGFIFGSVHVEIPNGGLYNLKDKIVSTDFGIYDEDAFSKDLFHDNSELSLQDVYHKAIDMTQDLKTEPNRQSSPIVTCGRGYDRGSSDSESSVLSSSSRYKSSGRGFSKNAKYTMDNSSKKKSTKGSSDSESSIINELLNELSASDSNSEVNNSGHKSSGRGFSKINQVTDEIGLPNIVKKKSSGRGFTKSIPVQKKNDSHDDDFEVNESNFEDYETDGPLLKNNTKTSSVKPSVKGVVFREKVLEKVDFFPAGGQFFTNRPVGPLVKNSTNTEKHENKVETMNLLKSETDSTAAKPSVKRVVFREKVLEKVDCIPAGGKFFTKSPKSVPDADKSQKSHKNFQKPVNTQKSNSNEKSVSESDDSSSKQDSNKEYVDDEVKQPSTSLISEPKKNCPPGKCDCDLCEKTFDSRIVFEPTTVNEAKRAPVQKKFVKPSLLFKKSDDENTEVTIKRQKKDLVSVTENLLAPRILVHSKFLIHPVDDLYLVPFHSEVQQILRRLKYEKPTRVQQYAWPAIMRGQHVFLVGPKGTGKTMAYIPAICTFILTDIPDLPQVNGPLAIVICPGVKIAEIIYKIINKLINSRNKKNIRLVVPPFKHQHKTEISGGVDILICTPNTLILMLKEKLISLKRLLYVVLESSKLLFDIFSKEIETLFKIFQMNLENRKFGQSIQLISISNQWSKPIEQLAHSLKTTPSICIGAYLEAALYGRADIKIEIVNVDDKPYKVKEILENQSKVYKSVVIYNEVSEIEEALKYLETHGIEYAFLDGRESVEEKREINRRWFNSISGQHFVLVCNDDVLNTDLAITDAFIVIQYSLPSNSWSQFVYRFSSFLDNYTSPIVQNNNQVPRCKMHIFLDGTNTEQFPRMVQFLQRMNCKITNNISNIYDTLVENIEENKRKNNMGLCYNLLMFGSCNDLITVCKGRHYLYEKLDKETGLPQSGIIKVQILHFESPTTYYCRLLEHIDATNVTHTALNRYEYINKELSKLMQSEDGKKLVLEVNVGYMYIIEVNGTYERCKITEITQKGAIRRASHVKVKLIDIGKKIIVATNCLYILPDKFRTIPPQAIQVCLSDLGPCDKDSTWSEASHHFVETAILNKIYQNKNTNSYFIGKIQLQLNNRLYVDNLILQEIVESKPVNITVNKLNIRDILFKKNLVEKRPYILKKLYELCEKFNIQLPDYTLPKLQSDNTKEYRQIEPQWAHLENCVEYNEVYFSAAINADAFFVKLSKNDDVLNQLRKDIKQALDKPFYLNEFPIVEGNCYLVKDTVDDTYDRVILKEIRGNQAHCLFVDFGDYITVPISELKFLMDKHIKQLPFQILECKLYGIKPIEEKWSTTTLDILYDLAHEPDTDIFRSLYVKVKEIEDPIHTGYKKYSVVLLDNFDNNKIINNLFVDMNLATKVCTEPIQIECDDPQPDPIETIYTTRSSKLVPRNEYIDCNVDDEWDFQMFNGSNFMTDLLNISKETKQLAELSEIPKTNEGKETEQSDNKLPKMKVLPPVNYSKPNIVWQQTDTDIKLKIHVIGVTEYDLNVIHKKVLIFKTECNGKLYKLNMRLYAPIATNVKHHIQGFHVVVNASKDTVDNWPRLLLTTTKMPHITYNIDAIHVEDSDEEGLPSDEMIKNSKEAAKAHDADDGTYKYEFGSDEDYDESDVNSHESSD